MKLPYSRFLFPLFLLLAGCDVIPPPSADATRYYVLSGPIASADTAAGKIGTGRLRLGLKSVELASYLKTRSMIVRNGSNELVMDDFHRWAEPLGDGVARVLRARLLADPRVNYVSSAPFAFDADRDYDVAISVIRCEGGTAAGDRSVARFAAAIEISTADANPRVVARRVFVAPEAPWDGRDFGQLAGLLSEAVDGLGREIATELPAESKP